MRLNNQIKWLKWWLIRHQPNFILISIYRWMRWYIDDWDGRLIINWFDNWDGWIDDDEEDSDLVSLSVSQSTISSHNLSHNLPSYHNLPSHLIYHLISSLPSHLIFTISSHLPSHLIYHLIFTISSHQPSHLINHLIYHLSSTISHLSSLTSLNAKCKVSTNWFNSGLDLFDDEMMRW